MSKSKGHVLVLQDLVDQGIHPLGYRMFLMQAVYRMPQSFRIEAIRAAEKSWRRLGIAWASLADAEGTEDPGARQPFLR